MPAHALSDEELRRRLQVLEENDGVCGRAAQALGVSRATLRHSIGLAEERGIRLDGTTTEADAAPEPIIKGQIEHDEGQPVMSRRTRGTRRYLCTVAQNNTRLHGPLWENLNALADFYGAEILVARCTYDIANYQDSKRKKLAGIEGREDDRGLWYPGEIEPYIVKSGERVNLADDLVFVGNNVSPTTADPLSAMETLTGLSSMILPHNQFAMRSVATMKGELSKLNFTTGTISMRNYLPGKAGDKASFHHGYGALLVEVEESGKWWCRQINAKDSGTFYDLDIYVENGQVTHGHRPENINWGCIHKRALEDHVMQAVWGPGGILDQLRPRSQAFHDVLDFHARSHHEVKDPFQMFRRWVEGCDSVEDELRDCAEFIRYSHRDDILSLIVDSNHHRHFIRYLKEQDWRRDPANMRIFLQAAEAQLEAIERGDDDFMLFEWAMRRFGCPDSVRFLREDESYRICEHEGGGIELGLHGDRGANGARGTPSGLKKLPFKANAADKHQAGIWQGLYLSGLMPANDMGYNKGPSSWNRSFTVTHPNGKRQIVTMNGAEYRAA